eukprot:TRINITY_DN1485_c0_g1_i7.p1 TRINITY_DN1485_c0_g1~~TRINITY_DN1485_c0_g1_i7.p1  ORF type:complete len:261 (-),score=14.60 TRINITY_DN1485_c0_g1_i7:351-1133(-)
MILRKLADINWMNNLEIDLGIDRDLFDYICSKTNDSIKKSRYKSNIYASKSSIPYRIRIWLLLYWLRKYPGYDELGCIVGISASTISRELRFILPRVVCSLDFIKFPNNFEFEELDCMGAVDGTIHRRNRAHPNQHVNYSGSYRTHCLHVLATCGLNGDIYDLVISPGSNSDQSVFRMSQTSHLYATQGFRAFGDRGFANDPQLSVPLVNPFESEHIEQYNHNQYHYRSVIETVFARTKNFQAANNVSRCRFGQYYWHIN